MEAGSVIGYVLTALGGGGLVEVIRAVRESRSIKDQARRADVDLDLSVDKHRSVEEQRFIDNILRDNENLRVRILEVVAERDDYRKRLLMVEAELVEMKSRVETLQEQIHQMLRET